MNGTDPSNCDIDSNDISDIRKSIRQLESETSGRLHRNTKAANINFNGNIDANIRIYQQDQAIAESPPNLNPARRITIQFQALKLWKEVANQIILDQHLNVRQALVLRRIAERLNIFKQQNAKPGDIPQLLIYIGGGGGVGKSWVILAIDMIFNAMGQSNRLQLTASTGSTAAGINGRTIHSAVGMQIMGDRANNNSPANGGRYLSPTAKAR